MTKERPKVSVVVGDVWVTSERNSLQECSAEAKSIINDKKVSKYLNIDFPKKRFFNAMLGRSEDDN